MKSFLQEFADTLLHTYPTFNNIVVVLPSKRAGTVLRTTLAQRANKTMFAPTIFSIEHFVEHISQLETASSTEQLFTLYEAYMELDIPEKENFASFAKWGQSLVQDFNEIDRYLINSADIFSYLADIQEITHWSLQKDKSELIQNYIAFWNQMGALYTAFNQALKDKGLGHQGLVYRTATENLETYLEKATEKIHIFAGFNALNTAESVIIQEILKRGKADIFWDSDPYFLEDPLHDAGYFIRQHQQSWPWLQNNPLKGPTKHYSDKKNISIIGVPKKVSQAKYVGNLLAQLKKEDPVSFKGTAVILGDETLLNPLLNSIPEEINSINITMGYPLRDTTAAGLFSQYLALQGLKDPQGWYFQHILDFLSHPYVQILFGGSKKDTSQSLIQAIKTNNWAFVTYQKLLGAAPHQQELIQLLFFEKALDGSKLIEKCQTLVQLLRERFQTTKNHLGLEYLYKFYTLFNQLAEMIGQYPFVSDVKSLESLYNTLLRNETLDFQGEPLEGLQIMGMLESRLLDFETVILTSVNEGILPSGKSNNSFIPFDLKKYYKLPTYKEKDAIYTYHFYRLLQRAKNVYLLYNTEPDVLEGGEKSRLLTQLLTDENKIPDITEIIAAPHIRPVPIELLSINKDGALMELIKKHAAKGFSPTSLSNYIRNPLDFYKRNLLGIDDVLEVEETVASNTFGTIIHDSLEDLYRPFLHQYLEVASLQEMQKKIKPTVLHHFAKSFVEGDISRGKNLIAFHVVERYIQNFIVLEISAAKQQRIKILGLEEKLSLMLEVPGIDFPITLTGKLDRVDEVDGQIRIIDYKTGKVTQPQVEVVVWEDIIRNYDYSKAFQLLCYALMYNNLYPIDEIEAGIFSFKSINSGLLRFATKEKKGSRIKDMRITPEILAQFTAILHLLISEICDPNIPLTEKEV